MSNAHILNPGAAFLPSLRRIIATASAPRRLQLILTLLLTAAGTVAELVTIGAVLPLLAFAAAPDTVGSLPVIGNVLIALGAALNVDPIVAAALLLVVAALAATLVRLALSWVSQHFIYGLQQDLVMTIYGRALRQPYSWYVRQNSSVLVAGLDKIYLVAVGVVSPLLLAVTSAVMALCITIFLFLIDPAMALIAATTIGVIYLLISFYSRTTIRNASERLASTRTARIKAMQETLGGIRDIILDQSQPVFETRLAAIENDQRRHLIITNFLALAPRLIVEGGAIILLAVIAAWSSRQPGGVIDAVPKLGALALGAQRLLPMIQSVYLGWAGYSMNAHHLADVLALLDAPVETSDRLESGRVVVPFTQTIELRGVGFGYGGERAALADIDLTIARGERIGLIGKTGSGKSTLVDIVMGLLPPTKGALIVDGVMIGDPNLANWKAQIAHVPQAIFLVDDSIAANIAFGTSDGEFDQARILDAARKAGLDDFVAVLPAGLETRVGERGIRLSGGQRQRIGIARALYKRASLLVLDEATSALDDQTEADVMQSVGQLDADLTIILIAHRLSTVARCDRVYRLEGGRIVAQGAVDDVVGAGVG
ncbi:ABC transporter ATP-binding protein [Sphingomonas sp.]|uniref:ABC transporter ATP-binding protein n=1 Tax=Sphingomonas sp. TaxID=28214 RepID=UPI00286AF479|nr:ABC transporter ATP-binding protein [Sphingomonas sp.]